MEKNEVLRRTLSAMEAGQDNQALAALEEAERQLGSHEELLYARALVLIRLGRKTEARPVLEAALRQKPEDAAMKTLLQSLPGGMPGAQAKPAPMAEAIPKQVNAASSGWQPVHATGPYALVGPNPLSLAHFATSPELWDALLAFHGELATDPYVRMVDAYYRECRRRFGAHWHYLDAVNTVYAASRWLNPQHYLEIGVRRGRTACAVARACPSVNIHAFDMWIPEYAGMENPGPEFVRQELRKHGHTGQVVFTDGNSHQTVPEYLRAHPGLEFDLILVDGDHSEEGALADLLTVLPRLRAGGVLVFDDIVHPAHPFLLKVWRKAMEKHGECQSHEFVEAGYGVAFAVRKG